MRAEAIDGVLFADMIRAGAANLDANRKIVNDLNVFPIPDGDTGDNMYMTIESGAEELAGRENASLGDVASSASKWMLLGARGNSGVILSRIFAGISRGLSGVDEADPAVLSRAFAMGVDEAYGAVSVPVEGTILTVYKDAVRYAAERLGPDSTIRSYFDDFTAELGFAGVTVRHETVRCGDDRNSQSVENSRNSRSLGIYLETRLGDPL